MMIGQVPEMNGVLLVLILIAATWTAIWKGLALWKAARNKHKVWFVIILILNTLGILEIIYLITHRNKNKK